MNDMAMKRLDTDSNVQGDLIEVDISDDEINFLFKRGIINKINLALSKNIDDYEDEFINNFSELGIFHEILKEIQKDYEHSAIDKLVMQVNNALRFKTGVFFFF